MNRKAEYPVADVILNRWSPRAMSGESITDTELFTLFEAARWAPSSYNGQPWRFVYAKRDTPSWSQLFDLLVEFNQSWAKDAAALVVIISRNTFERNDKPARTHSFDTGAAWQNMALQGSINGLVVHGLEGFSYKRAQELLNIPDDHTLEAMCAIGKPGDKNSLPQELKERETMSDRKPIAEFVFEGTFKQ